MDTGDLIALVGANGSGKTTLVRTIAGLLKPLSGVVRIDPDTRISLVPQSKSLRIEFPMTLYQALANSKNFGINPFKKWIPNSEEEDILERTGVTGILNLLLRECSGGQLQKFLIARSLLSDANLIFLDEPLDALDETSQEDIMKLLIEYSVAKEKGFFIITHHLSKQWLGQYTQVLAIKEKGLTEQKERS